jgi:hypothetical protein
LLWSSGIVAVQELLFPSLYVTQDAKDVTIIADHERIVVQWNRKLFEAVEELCDFGGLREQGILSAINHQELLPLIVCGEPASEKTAVVRFVVEDVLVSSRVVLSVRIFGVEKLTVGKNPKHKVWGSVCELLYGFPPSSVMRRQKWKPLARFLS